MSRRRDLRPPVVAFVSLGCAKNTVDTERMLAALAESGFLVAEDVADADAAVVNTCGFIAAAREESLSVLRELSLLRRSGALGALVAVGCMVERLGDAIRREVPEVDELVGLGRLAELPHVLSRLLGRTPRGSVAGEFEGLPRLLTGPPGSAYLKIAEGCDNRCTYCAIPLIRGPLRSRRPGALLAEAEGIVRGGVVELNLIAQDVAAYGMDLGRPGLLTELLDGLERIEGLAWIRLLYAHPEHAGDWLVERLAMGGRICPYLDLPIQHMDDMILTRMGRGLVSPLPGGPSARIRALVRALEERVPGIALRTTVMVGFPGETGEAHQRMVEYVAEGHFAHLGVFCYSPEQGTAAAGIEGRVPAALAEERAAEVMEAQAKIAFGRLDGMVGREIEVLVELPARDGGPWRGRTRWDAPEIDSGVILTGAGLEAGEIVEAEVTGREGYDLLAALPGGGR